MGIFKSFKNYAPILGKEENTNICVPKKASYGGRTLIFFLLLHDSFTISSILLLITLLIGNIALQN